MTNVEKLAVELQPKTLIVAGGVACNLALREAAEKFGAKMNLPVYFPSKHLSTDNAAMIAAAGYFHLQKRRAIGFANDGGRYFAVAEFRERRRGFEKEKGSLSAVNSRFKIQDSKIQDCYEINLES